MKAEPKDKEPATFKITANRYFPYFASSFSV